MREFIGNQFHMAIRVAEVGEDGARGCFVALTEERGRRRERELRFGGECSVRTNKHLS